MLMSEFISKYKKAGRKKSSALELIKTKTRLVGERWTNKKQLLFDKTWDALDNVSPIIVEHKPEKRDELDPFEERFKLMAKVFNKREALKFYHDLWVYYNHKLFSNRMKAPGFKFTRDSGLKLNVRAYYSSKNIIAFNKRLFFNPFSMFCNTMVHEMCHQAVAVLDGKVNIREGKNRVIHGDDWKKWMRHCGLNPDRCTKSELMDYMNEDEKVEHKEKIEERKAQVASKVKLQPEGHTIAQTWSTQRHEWIKGWIVMPLDKGRKKWMFIEKPEGLAYLIVPAESFFEVPLEEQRALELNTIQWKQYSKHIEQQYISVKSRKKEQNAGKKQFTTNYAKLLQEHYKLIPGSRLQSFEVILYLLARSEIASNGYGTYNITRLSAGSKYPVYMVTDAVNWLCLMDPHNVETDDTEELVTFMNNSGYGQKGYTIENFLSAVRNYYYNGEDVFA
jgi:hypothetical protein